MLDFDTFFMREALKLANIAFDEDEVPVGAVVVCGDKIIGKGYNQVEKLNDPTAHAELLAITAACNFLGSKYLDKCTLYVTLEPCMMCTGALRESQNTNTAPIALAGDDAVEFQRIGAVQARIMTTSSALTPCPGRDRGSGWRAYRRNRLGCQ